MRRTLVLLNPHAAGGRAARLAPALGDAVDRHGATLVVPQSLDEALVDLAVVPSGARVVVAGGDGSVQRLLPALIAGGFELALLPCGTGNDTARAFGLHGMPWQGALQHALTAPARHIDLGLVEHDGRRTPFISSLCAGFDAAVGERALRAPRWLRGMPRYLWATLCEIARLRPWTLRVHCDEARVHEGAALFASTLNTPTYGSGMPAAPAARIDDGRLDLVLAGRFGRLGALAMMPLLLTGQHARHSRVHLQPFRELSIESEQLLPLAADGEPLAPARHVRIGVQAGALSAVCAR